eukprot:1136311-Pleurochrysis_carterae.AAC.3
MIEPDLARRGQTPPVRGVATAQEKPRDASQQQPHIAALTTAGVSAARAHTAARSACSARVARRIAITTATLHLATRGLYPCPEPRACHLRHLCLGHQILLAQPSTTALASSNRRKSGILTLTAPLGRHTTSIASRVRTSTSLRPSPSSSAPGLRASGTSLSATTLRVNLYQRLLIGRDLPARVRGPLRCRGRRARRPLSTRARRFPQVGAVGCAESRESPTAN